MNSSYRVLAYLLAANVEAVALLFGASFAADWLDSSYPQDFGWINVTIALAMVGIVHAWYRFIRLVRKMETEQRKSDESA